MQPLLSHRHSHHHHDYNHPCFVQDATKNASSWIEKLGTNKQTKHTYTHFSGPNSSSGACVCLKAAMEIVEKHLDITSTNHHNYWPPLRAPEAKLNKQRLFQFAGKTLRLSRQLIIYYRQLMIGSRVALLTRTLDIEPNLEEGQTEREKHL